MVLWATARIMTRRLARQSDPTPRHGGDNTYTSIDASAHLTALTNSL